MFCAGNKHIVREISNQDWDGTTAQYGKMAMALRQTLI